MNILIVDDDESCMNALANLLKYEYDFDLAADGVDALEKLSKKNFDLVITDIKMPRMDGVELVKQIKKLGKKTQIIVITGYPYKENKIELEKMNISMFLSKPINVESFMETLSKISKEL